MVCKPEAWTSTAPGVRVWPCVQETDAGPRFGTGVQSRVWQWGAVRSCEALQQPPAEGTSRQRSACLSSSGCLCTGGESQTGQVPLHREGKASQEWTICLGEGFCTHEVVFCRPEPPCHALSVPVLVFFLCCVRLCEPCDVFQMCLCVPPPGWSAVAQDVSFPFPMTFCFLWQGVLPETFHFPEAWYCVLVCVCVFLWFCFVFVFLLCLTPAASSWGVGSVFTLLLSLETSWQCLS